MRRVKETRLKDIAGYQVWKITDKFSFPGNENVTCVTYMLNTQDGDNINCFPTLPLLKKYVKEVL